MKREIKSVLLTTAVIAASLGSNIATAEMTANVAATSNYIWRGVSVAGDEAAVSGGVDYTQDSGFYAGGWTSSLGGNNQYELDLYAGYRGKHKAIEFDVGVIQYRFPVGADELDFMELEGKVMYDMYTFTLATTLTHEDSAREEDAVYMGASAEKDIKGMTMEATIGRYSGDDVKADVGDDYLHYGVSLSKDNITLAVQKNNLGTFGGIDRGDLRTTVTWSMDIDLM